MKKCISILLLTMLLYDFVGYAIVFHFIENSIKEEAVEIIQNGNKEALNIIRLSSKEASEVIFRDKNEIVFRGQLYDVASLWVQGDSTYLQCYNDTKEESLQTSINIMVGHNAQYCGCNTHGHTDLSSNLPKDYFLAVDNKWNYSIEFQFNAHIQHEYAQAQADHKVIIPPPQVLFS